MMRTDELETQNIIRDKLKNILDVNIENIPSEQDLFTIGLDSIKTVMFIVELEGAFDILIEDHELLYENFATIHLIDDLVKRKLVKKKMINPKQFISGSNRIWLYNVNQEQKWNDSTVFPSVTDLQQLELVNQQEQQLLLIADQEDKVIFHHNPMKVS